MGKLMKYVDVCIANEEDADKVFGIRPADNNVEAGKINRAGYQDVAEAICNRFGCKKVAITLREIISANDNRWSAMLYENGMALLFPNPITSILWIAWEAEIPSAARLFTRCKAAIASRMPLNSRQPHPA